MTPRSFGMQAISQPYQVTFLDVHLSLVPGRQELRLRFFPP